jgi:hypothetical protein
MTMQETRAGFGNDHWQRRGVRFNCHVNVNVNVFSRSYTSSSSLRACRSIKVVQKLVDFASWQHPSSR